jgi:threonine aldolase
VGKDAAVFVPSGTMGNQIALSLLAPPGTNVVVGRRQHVLNHEMGASGRNGQYQLWPVDDPGGVLDAGAVASAIAAGAHHHPEVSAICVENTHMPAGGAPVPLDAMRSVAGHGLPVHLDGARLFNASIATGVPVASYAACATTVMCCLSKGLAAPVGSLLAVPSELELPARRERKRFGGAMRQAGVLAAAGLVALDTMIQRLADDHERAARLADAVAERWPGSSSDPFGGTNLVVFGHRDTAGLLAHLESSGVLAGTIAPGTVRLAVHCDVDDAAIARAVAALASAPA